MGITESAPDIQSVAASTIALSDTELVLGTDHSPAYWHQNYLNSVLRSTSNILNQSASARNTETALLQIRDYFRWHLQQSNFPISGDSSFTNVPSRHMDLQIEKNAYDLTGVFTHAVDQLAKKVPRQPWTLINTGCDMARVVFQQQEQDLIRVLFLLFTDQRWYDFPDLRLHLLRFLASTAEQVLGSSHPLTVILRLLPTYNTLVDSAEPALKLMLDMVIERSDNISSDICRYQWALSDLLRMQKNFPAAADICQKLIRESSKANGYAHKTTRISMRRLGRIYYDLGLYNEAEKVLLEALSVGLSEHGPQQPDICDIYTCDRLGFVYLAKADYTRCEYYWNRALNWVQKRWPGDDLNAMAFSQQLEKVLILKRNGHTRIQGW
ncbi:hypothetical protein Asppvi_007862 [Aspergillus pseudoviridinutans]|uniref:Tetratricopeptide repeat domain protein n=1 Tax=Aspergillus pseudoviridinutans TaxID=1517512 RepID=A0A9P3BJJ8_9EURO|nr:uncharacterized protein Asppvi_007862 [Aspergillus pseudoviridinutans]GIJ88934.1 hypothetical protein Asppvi_007862 [Aspergillus pseudoviridinutans]